MTKVMLRRATTAGAATLVAVAGWAAVPSATADPAGTEAAGTAVEGAGDRSIGRTTARADENGARATAAPLYVVGGVPNGGSVDQPGRGEGSLASTGDTPVGRVDLLPWAAAIEQADGVTTASSEAALVSGFVAHPELVDLAVLRSTSSASNDDTSGATSTSDVVALHIGGPNGLRLVLVHTDMSSDGPINSHLADVGGTKIGEQATSGCALPATAAGSIACAIALNGLPIGGSDTGTPTAGPTTAVGAAPGTAAAGVGGTAPAAPGGVAPRGRAPRAGTPTALIPAAPEAAAATEDVGDRAGGGRWVLVSVAILALGAAGFGVTRLDPAVLRRLLPRR